MTYAERLEVEFGTTLQTLADEALAAGMAQGHEGDSLDSFVEFYLEGGPTTAEIRMQMIGL